MTLDFLERGSTDDLKRLAELRCLAREALKMASSAGVLRFATIKGFRAWDRDGTGQGTSQKRGA